MKRKDRRKRDFYHGLKYRKKLIERAKDIKYLKKIR